jgi:hypothetical protein|tara:strand:+ start:47 stop:481 length:435 start_codon:yes stop_codon:yes gene_type:complete
MKTQLLCTFTKRNRLYDTVDLIIVCNEIVFNKIYVFQNENDYHQLMCTYNVEFEEDFVENVQDTISLHRKKQSNSLYTINALNEIIRSLNSGVLDKSFPVPWENYRNTLLLTNETGLNKIPTRIYTIIDVKTWDRSKYDSQRDI